MDIDALGLPVYVSSKSFRMRRAWHVVMFSVASTIQWESMSPTPFLVRCSTLFHAPKNTHSLISAAILQVMPSHGRRRSRTLRIPVYHNHTHTRRRVAWDRISRCGSRRFDSNLCSRFTGGNPTNLCYFEIILAPGSTASHPHSRHPPLRT